MQPAQANAPFPPLQRLCPSVSGACFRRLSHDPARHCPLFVAANGCSGNGICGSGDACECYDNYVGNDCSERMCAYGYAWADQPAGDLNHDGELTLKFAGTPQTLDYTTVANRRSFLIDNAYGYVLTQFSTKIVPEYFPIYTDATTGIIKGQDGKPVGGLKAKADEAHFYAECSGRGSCDRSSGECACFPGFTGVACKRSVCPNDCSGAGICMTAREIAAGSRIGSSSTSRGRNYRALSYFNSYTTYEGVANRFDYNHWDAEMSTQCICDPGRTGPDCSLRVCPYGRDPLVRDSSLCGNSPCQPETQAIYLKLGQASSGSPAPIILRLGYTDVYSAQKGRVLYSHPFTLDAGNTVFSYEQQIAKAINSFPNRQLFGVNVSATGFERAGAKVDTRYPQSLSFTDVADVMEFKVNFDKGPQGNVDGISVNFVSGNTNLLTFGSAEADASGARATVTGSGAASPAAGAFFTSAADQIAPVNGNTPFIQCSGRGTCDLSAGLCECFTGYFGPSCAEQNALAV